MANKFLKMFKSLKTNTLMTQKNKAAPKTPKRSKRLSPKPRVALKAPCSPRASKRWNFERPLRNPVRSYIVSLSTILDPETIAPIIQAQAQTRIPATVSNRQQPFTGDRDAKEITFCKCLAGQLKGICEFPTPDGRIDVLTETLIIEAKLACNWKHGIGQVLIYGSYFPSRQKVLWLIGDGAEFYAAAAKPHCDRLDIAVRTDLALVDFFCGESTTRIRA